MFGTLAVRVDRPRSRAEGDVGLGSGQTTRRISSRGRAHRSRQRAAAVGRWRDHRPGGSPARLRAVVQRHHPDRSLRRGPHGRRRFRSARRRDQFRHRAGARGSRAARRRRRHRRSAGQRHAQDRPPAAARRSHRHPAGHSGFDHDARRRQPRDRARAPVRAGRGQPLALAIGALRQHSALQCAEDAHASPTHGGAADEAAGTEPDAEVSFFTRDLSTVLPRAKIAAVVGIDEILARVRDAANWDGTGKSRG